MNERNNEKFVVVVANLASAGVVIENTLLSWEFWVPFVVLIGMLTLWPVCLSERIPADIRQIYYFGYGLLILFYHGVHKTSFFDVALIISFGMATYSIFNRVYMMNILLLLFVVIWVVHFSGLSVVKDTAYSRLGVSRILLHAMIVVFLYYINVRTINHRLEAKASEAEKDRLLEANEVDMEDFLSNISHEFRTPVNVVNGMTDILIKRNAGSEAYSIKDAGIKLAYQIEDIQDYTECKRKKVLLEEDNYMSTSLINDMVTAFRLLDNSKGLELVVDLDPKTPSMLRGDIKKLHKIFRHLLSNAVKFTKQGGILIRMYTEETEKQDNRVNLCIEVTDTGIGMDHRTRHSVMKGMYQLDKRRNRSSGGIGLGLYIVYGFAHVMGGSVKLESQKRVGTTVRVTLPQTVADAKNCLALSKEYSGDILFHVRSDKYKVPRVRDFYRSMATNLAVGIGVPLYSAETVEEVERLREKLNVKYIFMGQEEYEENPAFFDAMSKEDMVVAVSAASGFRTNAGSGAIVMPKPLYAYPAIKILNEGKDATDLEYSDNTEKPLFTNVRALVVDDEPMNLVVASGLFKEYEMLVDTAESGQEGISKYTDNDYDVVFMDHMMPEMDGVEAMKRIKNIASEQGKDTIVIALTANAVSGAKEMFIKEGFDGFIAKPIFTQDFERTMKRVLSFTSEKGGEKA